MTILLQMNYTVSQTKFPPLNSPVHWPEDVPGLINRLSKRINMTSWNIQNKMIDTFTHTVHRRQICAEIQKAGPFAIHCRWHSGCHTMRAGICLSLLHKQQATGTSRSVYGLVLNGQHNWRDTGKNDWRRFAAFWSQHFQSAWSDTRWRLKYGWFL